MDHSQTIGGDTAKLFGGYIPPSHPCFGTPPTITSLDVTSVSFAYSSPSTNSMLSSKTAVSTYEPRDSLPIEAWIGISVAIVVVLAIIIVVAVVIKRKQASKKNAEQETEQTSYVQTHNASKAQNLFKCWSKCLCV